MNRTDPAVSTGECHVVRRSHRLIIAVSVPEQRLYQDATEGDGNPAARVAFTRPWGVVQRDIGDDRRYEDVPAAGLRRYTTRLPPA